MKNTFSIGSKKFFLLSVFIFLFFISTVVAQPPFQGGQGESLGYEIRTQFLEVQKLNTDHEYIAHIYNTSTGLPITSPASCFFHLYDSHGNHLAELTDTTPSHNFDYEFPVAGANFSTPGEYSYLIQCNSSVQGGYIAVTFDVTSSGFLDNLSILYFLSIGALVLLGLAIYRSNYLLGFAAGSLLTLAGAMMLIYGINDVNTVYSRLVGMIALLVGLGISLSVVSQSLSSDGNPGGED